MRFDGSVVVVTGGAHGIGRATVERFLTEGARVAMLDVDVDAARRTAEQLRDVGSAFVVPCDVLHTGSVTSAIDAVLRQYERIDVLASVAGGDQAPPDSLDDRHWDQILDLNLRGPVRLIDACLPALRASAGSIVLVGSVNGVAAFGEPAYSSAKAGLSLLARNLAVTLGGDGIRVNVVAPGTVRTRVWDGQPGGADRMRRLYPLGRVGEPQDIAAAIAFLASADASWITGVTLPVDGGGTAGPLATMPRD